MPAECTYEADLSLLGANKIPEYTCWLMEEDLTSVGCAVDVGKQQDMGQPHPSSEEDPTEPETSNDGLNQSACTGVPSKHCLVLRWSAVLQVFRPWCETLVVPGSSRKARLRVACPQDIPNPASRNLWD